MIAIDSAEIDDHKIYPSNYQAITQYTIVLAYPCVSTIQEHGPPIIQMELVP